MPFQYAPYHSPYVGSIAETMLRRGDIAAQQAKAVADAQARAAEISGQAWAGAASNVAGSLQQATDPRRKLEALQVGELQKNISEGDTLKSVIKNTPKVDIGNGVLGYDVPAISDAVVQRGGDPAMVATHLNPINESFQQVYATKLAAVKLGAQSIIAAGNDPTLALDYLDTVEKNHVFPPQQTQHFRDLIQADPANVAKITALLSGPQKPIMGKPGETPLNPINAQPMGAPLPDKPVVVPQGGTLVGQPPATPGATAPAPRALFASPPAPTTAGNEAAIRALYAKRASGQPLSPADTASIQGYEAEKSSNDAPVTVKTMVNGKPVERVMTRAQALAAGEFPSQPPASITINNEKNKALDLPTWATDASRPSGVEGNRLDPTLRMTPNGLHQAALNYIANGQFPPTGRGTDPIAVAQRAAITSKVGAIAADAGMDEPALRAFYKSNAASLAQQQKSMDAVQGFMATADRNSDLLKKTLAKIPDSGSPLLNVPLRAVEQRALGNVDLSQFRTYVQSVQNEYARIISQPNLAGQLTDSARKEAEQLVDPNATVAQIIGSVEALRNEGANRLQSLGEQIQRIQGRMTVPPQAPAAAAPPAAGRMIEALDPQGNVHHAPAGTPLPSGWKLK